jgi:hypothetical protein
MNYLRMGFLLFMIQALTGCNQADKVIDNKVEVAKTSQEESLVSKSNGDVSADRKNSRAEFKKSYPTPDNIEKIKLLWSEAERNYFLSAEKGVTASVEIIYIDENVEQGTDVFIISKGVKQLREYRGKTVAVTFDQRVCKNYENTSDSIDDAANGIYNTVLFPSEGNEFKWVCETGEDSVNYALWPVDFDYVIKSSINSALLNGKPVRELKLLIAEDFSVSPFLENSEVTLIIGESDTLPRALRQKDTYRDKVDVAQWVYDYESPVSFLVLPKEEIKPEEKN